MALKQLNTKKFNKERLLYVKILMLIATVFLFTSCTDASRSKLGAYGDKHLVELYSGGKMVKSWVATGKVLNSEQSDGYYFRDEATGVNVEVSGDVVITRLED